MSASPLLVRGRGRPSYYVANLYFPFSLSVGRTDAACYR